MRCLLTLIVVVFASCLFGPGESRAAEVACSESVLADWFADGRIDRVYALTCYESAIAALPTDLRDYSDAEDVIGRALSSAARGETSVPMAEAPAATQAAAGAIAAPSGSTFPLPLPLVVLFGVALAVLAAGGLSSLARLHRGR